MPRLATQVRLPSLPFRLSCPAERPSREALPWWGAGRAKREALPPPSLETQSSSQAGSGLGIQGETGMFGAFLGGGGSMHALVSLLPPLASPSP